MKNFVNLKMKYCNIAIIKIFHAIFAQKFIINIIIVDIYIIILKKNLLLKNILYKIQKTKKHRNSNEKVIDI